MTGRALLRRLVSTVTALATAWVALWSWSGLIEHPGQFLGPALVGGLVIAAIGTAGRWIGWGWYAVLPAQLVAALLYCLHHVAGGLTWSGWLPTSEAMTTLVEEVRAGAVAVNVYAAPVSDRHPETAAYLLVVGLTVILSVDLLACGLRRPAWAGLPLLVTLTVPVSVLAAGLHWAIFAGTALLFVLLLADDQVGRVRRWAPRPADDQPGTDEPIGIDATMRGDAVRVGLAVTVVALLVPALLPLGDGLISRPGQGDGSGGSGSSTVRLRSPMIDIRRDLIRKAQVPLVLASTDATDPTYLRISVLDRFTGQAWLPSRRNLPAANTANGLLPPAPGLSVTTRGTESQWRLELGRAFVTSWLPTPYPTREIEIDQGDWRYDVRTLDIANAENDFDSSGLRYRLRAFAPDLSATALDRAFPPPDDVVKPMTALPSDLPEVIRTTAARVTSGATTNYAKAVALQNWFRSDGGFTYSLEPDSDSGMEAIAQFITTERFGYCEQFATAMATMARTLGIPARVSVGFLGPTRLDDGDLLYTSDDLHAWPELYFSGSGWVRFEPTPAARVNQTPSWTRERLDRSEQFGAPSAAPTAGNRRPEQAETPTPVDTAEQETTDRGLLPRLLPVAVGAAALLVLLALPRAIRSRRRRRALAVAPRRRGATAVGAPDAEGPDMEAHDVEAPDVEALWRELCDTAVDLGLSPPLGRSVRETGRFLSSVGQAGPDDEAADREALRSLVAYVERARYARRPDLDPAVHAAMAAVVVRWSALLAGRAGRGARLRALWLPASVLVRSRRVSGEDSSGEHEDGARSSGPSYEEVGR